MSQIKVSLIASSVRPQLYEDFFKSLKGTSEIIEIKFAGNLKITEWAEGLKDLDNTRYIFHYIPTKNIKPAQCYEIARRNAEGECICWVADDCEFPNNVIGKAYSYWKRQENEKLILSIQTRETGYNLPEGKLFDMNNHRFFGYKKDTPLMAPLGFMSRKFLDDLGGFDKRYVCGQYENDVVMRAYKAGAEVRIFGDENCFVDIDHLGKSIRIGESKDNKDFLNRPFATGYREDRRVLEGSWIMRRGKFVRIDEFQPYEDRDLLTISQSNKGKWE